MKNTVLLTTLSLTIIAGATLSTASEGHGPGKGPHFSFEEMDANNDGKLTGNEMSAFMASHFADADTNGDGFVNADELRAHMQERMAMSLDKRVAHMMERRDTNGDGQLSADEMQPRRMGKMMKHADSDGDGAISRDEFDAMKSMRGDHKRRNCKNDG